jgi:putative flavoprotein involved in K+ transport
VRTIPTTIIGAGQAGLAVSWHLTAAGRDHVVVERGEVGERWRRERWESMRLLTPNWMTRLPGCRYTGDDPHGHLATDEVARQLQGYAAAFGAPVQTGTTVRSVRRSTAGFTVETDRGTWSSRDVVVATGWCDAVRVPPCAVSVPLTVTSMPANRYRRPADLPAGGVLVVGASASGVQIADELARAGRPVTLAVGRHTRVPRRHRGRDLFWWLDAVGALDRLPTAPDGAVVDEPSLQLVGRRPARDVDLGTLARAGVRVAGRVVAVDGGRVHLGTNLQADVAAADARLRHLLARFDAHAATDAGGPGFGGTVVGDAEPPPPVELGPGPRTIDLRAEGLATVIWATGYRRSYPWLHVPVIGSDGDVRHHRGATPVPGLQVVGMRHQTSRRSTYLDGADADAAIVVDRITAADGGTADAAAAAASGDARRARAA